MFNRETVVVIKNSDSVRMYLMPQIAAMQAMKNRNTIFEMDAGSGNDGLSTGMLLPLFSGALHQWIS